MKKLMTSLLALLLCGLSFCWADVTVSGKVLHDTRAGSVGSENWVNATIQLFSGATAAYTATVGDVDGQYGVYTIENVAAGTYKIVFGGNAEGRDFTYEEENFVVGTEDITKDFKAVLDAKVTMTVEVGYEEEYFGTTQFKGIANATVTVKQGETEVGTGTTTSGWDAGKTTFNNIDPTKDYTISASASGYKNNTVTTKGAEKVRIVMEEALTTVSGTLKLGETALTELPEGMTLVIGANGTGYTAQINESGYTVECKPGNLKVGIVDQIGNEWSSDFYKNLTENYTVTTPANASFTVPGDAETFTQDIVLTKAYAAVIGVDASDKLRDNELTLTKQGETEVAYKASFLASPYPSNHFRFNKVEPGTYTLGLNKFGFKLKGEAPTVTVATDWADVTLSAPVEIEEIEEVTATWKGTVKYYTANYSEAKVTNATVALYARDENGQKTGEPLVTTASDENGQWAISITGKLNTAYILSVTHAAILPATTTVTATQAENSPYMTINALWASGNVVYSGEISSGTIKAELPGGYFYPTIIFEPETGMYYIGSSTEPNGSGYTISFEGKDADKFVLTAKEENLDFSTGAITKDLTVAKDENKGYMTIRLRYLSTTGEILPVSRYFQFDDNAYTYPDNDGNKEILVEKGTTHSFAFEEYTYGGYGAATIESINAFSEIQGKMLPNDTTIYIPGLEAAHIKLSGTVTMPEGVGEGVKVALRTVRDLEVLSTAIVKEGDVYKYTFNDVPVAASGSMPIFLVEPDAKYNATYKVSVPYNYAVADNTNFSVDRSMSAENTKDITVIKIGCNVSGTVTPATSGEVTLTAAGATTPSYYADILPTGAFKFQGVAAGTYTLNVKCDGYETYATEVTVAASLEDMTVPAIALTAKMEIITVSGQIDTYNKATHEYFDGAKLEIWNSDNTKMLAETTMPASDGYGYIPSGFSFEATMGTKVIFKMTHPSIQPISQEFTVNGTTLFITSLDYVFVVEGADWFVMKDFKAEWNATFDSLKLSWSWPEGAADAKVQKINLNRKIADASSSEGEAVKYWSSNGAWFSESELPVAFADALTQPLKYSYTFEFRYAGAPGYTVTFIADMREGERYTLAYTVNDTEMGSISSYGQPEGEYMEDDQITVTAVAKSGYKFVEFLQNDKKLTEEELKNVLLLGADNDSAAVYSFRMPAENVTVKAVFATKSDVRYTVTLLSSNEAWGTVEGAGNFEEGTEVTVKAVVTDADKYAFVAWKEGDKEVSKEATYKFKLEKDITLTAVFEELSGNESLQAAQWAIFAEDGAIVIKGLNGDRYDIYDLNGRLSGQALCTGAEIRLSVAPNKLYIVRRISAGGAFDAKKIVVR